MNNIIKNNNIIMSLSIDVIRYIILPMRSLMMLRDRQKSKKEKVQREIYDYCKSHEGINKYVMNLMKNHFLRLSTLSKALYNINTDLIDDISLVCKNNKLSKYTINKTKYFNLIITKHDFRLERKKYIRIETKVMKKERLNINKMKGKIYFLMEIIDKLISQIYDFIFGYGYFRGYKSLEIINNSVVGRFK
jgi:hypothetical protein